jgi:serine protease AprX
MKKKERSQVTDGPQDRPLKSTTLGAGWGRAVGLTLLALSAVPSYGGSRPVLDGDSQRATAKYSRDLRGQGNASGMVTVIVQHRQMPTSAHLKGMQDRGAMIRSKFQTIRAVTMRVPVSMLSELANDPNVAYITPDRPLAMTSNPQTEEFATAVEADVAAAQYGLDGTGVGVAVIDSGIAPNSDLNNGNGSSRVVYSQSFVAGDNSTADAFGHGTHVAGLIGGSGAGSGTANGYPATYAGMAPNVNIINLRATETARTAK